MKQPKPDSMKYTELIEGISKGIIKIPKFQREFVWGMDETAGLLDSILKGYPIGTFILWETAERMSNIKNIGDLDLPDTPEGKDVMYVLDGQQRITSLYAARQGAKIKKPSGKKKWDYTDIYVNLDDGLDESDDNIITATPEEREKCLPLRDVLGFDFKMSKKLEEKFTGDQIDRVDRYCSAFKTYDFSIVTLKKEDIDSAIEVFTRINTGGKTLTLFEIMVAKTYSESEDFDMQKKWDEFINDLKDSGVKYEGISSILILNLLSLLISSTKDCKRKTILKLERDSVIENWERAISALKYSIDYFKSAFRIPVSQLLPYDSLLVPFAYFFHHNNHDKPTSDQRKFLEEFFWRISLSYRYSSGTESKLTQDIKRIDNILNGVRPEYNEIKVYLDEEDLIETNFSAGDSYCKAVLCLLAYQKPRDFHDGDDVILDNAWLQRANSKNYHHFFPKAYLKNADRSNSVVNITLVSDRLNKSKIGAKAPSKYIGEFKEVNERINKTLKTHLINMDGFGIEDNDYEAFLKARARKIYKELKSRIDPH